MKVINNYSLGESQQGNSYVQKNNEVFVSPENFKWLNQLKGFCHDAKISVLKDTPMERKAADGLLYFIVNHNDHRFAVIYNDFKVNGGSFGKTNSKRIKNFISYISELKIPLVFLTNSIGARLMDGREVFTPAFSLIPELARFSEKNLLITGNIGRSLGLGAIIFSMGHYRFSLDKNAPINLTGPEVIKLFFGKGHDFNEISCPKKHQKTTSLVHELCQSKDEMLAKINTLISFIEKKNHFYDLENPRLEDIYKLLPGDRIASLLDSIADEVCEVFQDLDQVVRTFLIRRNGKLCGVMINPPGNPNNIISIHTLEKYQAALSLFKAMGLPLVSFLDTPGASPLNFVESKKDIINCIKETAEMIIKYPYPKAGFVIGRCFGGATILSMPKVFGGDRQYIVEGSQVGIMHEKIIFSLLENNQNLLSNWEENKKHMPADYSDLIHNGTIDEVINYESIQIKFDEFLFE